MAGKNFTAEACNGFMVEHFHQNAIFQENFSIKALKKSLKFNFGFRNKLSWPPQSQMDLLYLLQSFFYAKSPQKPNERGRWRKSLFICIWWTRHESNIKVKAIKISCPSGQKLFECWRTLHNMNAIERYCNLQFQTFLSAEWVFPMNRWDSRTNGLFSNKHRKNESETGT